MADPSTYRPRPGEIPTDPGVYRFRDKDGRVIYVGKAKNLRQRLSSYVQDVAALHHRTATMVRTGASVEWTVVSTEVEALQLESAWLEEFDPRVNVKYRAEHEVYRLSILPAVEAKRPLLMGEYDARQLIRAYQMVVNRPSSDKFPEESEKVLNHEMQLFDETAAIRDIYLKYQLHRISGSIKGQVKVDEGQAVLDAIGQTNELLAGIGKEIVRQDIEATY